MIDKFLYVMKGKLNVFMLVFRLGIKSVFIFKILSYVLIYNGFDGLRFI